jgi:hypothetical protein
MAELRRQTRKIFIHDKVRGHERGTSSKKMKKKSGDTTFRYPSLRLFRERQAGGWADVVGDIRAALLGSRAARPSP